MAIFKKITAKIGQLLYDNQVKDALNQLSLLDETGLVWKGEFTPTIGQEYPLTPSFGWSYTIKLTADYTFTTGDLIGQTVGNGTVIAFSTIWVFTTLDAYSRAESDAVEGRVTQNETDIGLNTTAITTINDSKGAVNGIATLDGDGTVPASQLPSYVDDVLEFANLASFPATGETGKIYIAIDTGFSYRWTGTIYVDITSKVDSVNGKSGVVTLNAVDIPYDKTGTDYIGAEVKAILVEVNGRMIALEASSSLDPAVLLHTIGNGGGNPEGISTSNVDEVKIGSLSIGESISITSVSNNTTSITLTVSSHNAKVGDTIYVTGLDFGNGTDTVTAVTATTITYASTELATTATSAVVGYGTIEAKGGFTGSVIASKYLMWEGGKHSLTNNDGLNVALRFAHESLGSDKMTEDGFASRWHFNQTNGTWTFDRTATSQLTGETCTWVNHMNIDANGIVNMPLGATVNGRQLGKNSLLWSGVGNTGTITLDTNEANFSTFNSVAFEMYYTGLTTMRMVTYIPLDLFKTTIGGARTHRINLGDSGTSIFMDIYFVSNTQIQITLAQVARLTAIYGA